MNELFRRMSSRTADALGSPWMFMANVFLILIWLIAGPFFNYSTAWQLVINTGTTILTYLAVFLIQNTQNRDAKAIHLKLDELLKGVDGARTQLMGLQNLSDKELDSIELDLKKQKEDLKN